jgi:type VI secretion system protein ImpB
MPADSIQHKLDRVRRPRVQITYDVETGGALQKIELPFVVGVLADLSADARGELPPLKQRRFAAIDRDNFTEVMAKAAPKLRVKVPNRLGQEGTISAELKFEQLEDFEPGNVAKQIAPLKALLDLRLALTEIRARLEANDKLAEQLLEVLKDPAKLQALADELGVKANPLPPATDATKTTPEEKK